MDPQVAWFLSRSPDDNSVKAGKFELGRPEATRLAVGHATAARRQRCDGAATLPANRQTCGRADSEDQCIVGSKGIGASGRVLP